MEKTPAMEETNTTTCSFPSYVRQELCEARRRIDTQNNFQRVWDQLLTEDDRRRLGGDLVAAFRARGTVTNWMTLRGVSEVRAIIDVASQLNCISALTRDWLLRETGETPATIEQAIAAAVTSADVVLVERPRTFYWRGSLVDVDWNSANAFWVFVATVCERAKAGAGVDHTDFGKDLQPDYVSKIKSKLYELPNMPQAFVDGITACGRSTQKLDLPPQSIRLFRIKSIEVLEEVVG